MLGLPSAGNRNYFASKRRFMSATLQVSTGSDLQKAINAYRKKNKGRLDERALAMLRRLALSAVSAQAFARLNLTEPDEHHFFLTVCVFAEQLARRYPEFLRAEKKMASDLPKLEKAVGDLYSFVNSEAFLTADDDLLSETVASSLFYVNRVAIFDGLKSISMMIEERRKTIERLALLYQGSRKSHQVNAPIIVATRYFAAAVQILTGKAHQKSVVRLVPVVLGKAGIGVDRSVIHGLRAPASKTDAQRKRLIALVAKLEDLRLHEVLHELGKTSRRAVFIRGPS
jgi:hypothetical protein